MTKNIFLFTALSFIGICVFFSCSKVDSDNNTPTMEILSIKAGDVIYTDSAYTFEAIFSDEEGLSSYSIQIWHPKFNFDSITVGQLDKVLVEEKEDIAALFYKNFQTVNIFDSTYCNLKIGQAFKIDSILTVKGKVYPIRFGEHYFKVSLIDKSGHIVKDSFLIDVRESPKVIPR